MPNIWTILCYLFLPPKFIYRIEIFRLLCKSLGNALQGCEEDPIPRDLLARGGGMRNAFMLCIYCTACWWTVMMFGRKEGSGAIRIKKTNRIK